MKKRILIIFSFSLSAISVFQAGAQDDVEEEKWLKGWFEVPSGNDNCNPCLEQAANAVKTIRNKGEALGFNWGARYPAVLGACTKNHWQGIQRLSAGELPYPYFVISSSHRYVLPLKNDNQISLPAHFAVVEFNSRFSTARRIRSNRLKYGKAVREVEPDDLDKIVRAQAITTEYDHPGGMQTIGKYLLVGSDGNIEHSWDAASFSLWDMSNPKEPKNVWEPPLELPAQNANSTGILRLQDGRYLMLRVLNGARNLEFYVKEDTLLESGSGWELWDRWNYQELLSGFEEVDAQTDTSWLVSCALGSSIGYQNTNLFTECDTGDIYLIASRGRCPRCPLNIGGQDVLDAFLVQIPVSRPNPEAEKEGVIVTKVASRLMDLEGNSGSREGDFQAAAGAYVSPDNKLYYYATEHGATGKNGFVKMIEFGPQVPVDYVEEIEDAWVELYEQPDFEGRSVILDYADRNLRSYEDFRSLEEFDDLASSAIFVIPRGYKLRLFSGPQNSGAYVDLLGTDHAVRVSNLGFLSLSNDDGSDNTLSSAEWLEHDVVAVTLNTSGNPVEYNLHQNYPNPFNPETVIRYEIPEPAHISLEIYNTRGQLIKTLVDAEQNTGFYSVLWDGTDVTGQEVSSGTYVYQLKSGEHLHVKRLVKVR